MTSALSSLPNVTLFEGYDDASEAATDLVLAVISALISGVQIASGLFLSAYLFLNAFLYGRAVPYYRRVALPAFNNHVLPVLHVVLAAFLQLVKMGLEHAVNHVTGSLSTLPHNTTTGAINYCSPSVFFSAVLLVSLALLIFFPAVTTGIYLLWAAFLRRTHHFLARNLPFIFLRNPRRGQRRIPGYLFTETLTPDDATILPHKGELTYNQLQNHHVAIAGNTVSLLPTVQEATAGLHPSTGHVVSVPARPNCVHIIEGEIQTALDNGDSEATAACNLIHAVNHRLNTVLRPNLVPLRPNATMTLADCCLTHPGMKEVCIALHGVLARRANRRKLGALYPLCLDQHVKIAEADHQNRGNRRRRLNQIHGQLTIDAVWIDVPH